ncbi:6429_t:CDS:2 [Funneliformis geosporum]|uniref:17426_t:CDS:1 n=1 Tax=Funneliformis geosporum TaxID=1117311 RepID=A0A9W4SP35_9GLOM|nr:6429_t:CDS:2 [Funneliformis geosporum]CAI2177424.1 17426_t:CDS:2 [Funneliformis geosporum]
MFRSLVRINKQQLNKKVTNFRRSASTTTPAISEVVNRWSTLSVDEQTNVTKQIEDLQKQDWQKLSLEEKKAAYYLAFGNHGPREEFGQSGKTGKIIAGVSGVIIIGSGLYYLSKIAVTDKPRTINKEWEEATNERMIEQKSDPISGISSEGYKGKGYVVSE